MFTDPLIHDDRYEIRAQKTKVKKSGNIKFPLNEPILKSELIRVVGHYTFGKGDKVIQARIFGLNDSVIKGNKNLEGVRLRIHRNTISISLSNILNVQYDRNRYQILYNVIYELLIGEVIKYDLQGRTLDQYIHYLLSLFTNAAYEIRIDWNRAKGLPILDECRFKSKHYKQGFNSIALSNPKKGLVRKSGYFIKIYDKSKPEDVRIDPRGKILVDGVPDGHYSEEIKEFPIRLEITLFKNKLPRELLNGTAKENIDSLDYQINSAVCKNPLYPFIREYFDPVWYQDKAKDLTRDELERMGNNHNQYNKAVI